MKRQERLARREENGRLMEQYKTAKGKIKYGIALILASRTPSKQPFGAKKL